ncbi:hypothetical protein [Gordonia sp. 852002-50816_SCH5313054-c]|uniref:hypothetical protein n=1 Tax=Gordonia sp. 852002-50816_SCH5313054-c TaxID=1834093 RepID=UPI0012E846A5|nr:hypothetical protein [Gordonia sp. 852002-50816_SCH5313054-c]
MHAHVSHRGAILSAEAMHDGPAIDRLTAWIKENCTNTGQRLTILPRRDTPTDNHPFVRRCVRQGDVGILRNRPHSRGGPVFAIWPSIEHMAHAVAATPSDQVLVCLEWSESFAGWASAVGAYDAAADSVVPALDSEVVSDFEYLLMWDTEIFEGAKRGWGRERIHPTLRKLKTAGLDEQFVMTYALGLGASANLARHLAKHYGVV